MAVEVVTHVTFITQGRVCLSWRVSLESLHTVNSLLNMSVTARFCFIDIIALVRTDGGYHVILLRWRTGVEHLSMVSAHAGWPTHAQSPGMAVTVTRMTKYGVKTAVCWLTRQSFLSNNSGLGMLVAAVDSKVTTHWGNWGVTEPYKHQSQDCASKLAHSAEDNSLW